ncbi:LacI family DNA-binding transcriptional regulator [Candidatus Bipolaricaulota bacterium]|nr:LacI family DNA-binding transcriptional regulator [Candidatus Bipolaricaulota bacterium]
MKKRADIRDVAARAGVSLSTVSRVLNDRSENHMRPETREKVLEAIRDLNYAPVKAAQTLRRLRTRTLGIVLPDITNLYFALLARGIESVAFERGFTTLICDSNHQPERETQYLDMLRSEDVEGIIFVPVGIADSKTLNAALDQGIRVVAVDRRIPELPIAEVDNYAASFEMGEYVIRLGYRKIAYITGPETVSTSEDRLSGLSDALASNGIKLPVVCRGDFTFESGYACALNVLSNEKVDAILTANDLMAFGALRAAEELKRSVPKDLGVAGFDHVPHIPYATFMHPELTTIEVPIHELGREAASLLIDEKSEGVQLPTKLIYGGTCREHPNGDI